MLQKITLSISLLVTIIACQNSDKVSVTKAQMVNALQSPASDSCGEPFLFTDKNQLVYLSWIEKKDQLYHLRFATLKNDKWSYSSSIASGKNWFVNWADYPVIASTGDSHLIAHFLEKSDSGKFTYDIKYVTSGDNGKTWTMPKLLNEDGKKAEHGFVSIVPYHEKYFASWLDGRKTADVANPGHAGHSGHNGEMTLRGAIIGKDGSKEHEWELDDRVCDCCQTSVAISSEGPVVIYRDRSPDEIRDMGIVRLTNNVWSKPAIVYADNWKIDGCPVNGPRVDAIGNRLAVAWFTGNTDSGEVKVAFSFNGGAGFEKPVKVNKLKSVGRVDLVMFDTTAAIVSWMEGSLIKLARVHIDGTVDRKTDIAGSSEARSAGFPQITKSGNDIYVAWTDTKTKSIKMASVSFKD